MATGLLRRIKAAGISRATYYARVKGGMTPEEALTKPKGRRAGPNGSGALYADACEFVVNEGLLTEELLPSAQLFARMRNKGLPSRLAILARIKITVDERQEMLEHAQALGEHGDYVLELMEHDTFGDYLMATLKYAPLLTAEQHQNIMLTLARLVPLEDE